MALIIFWYNWSVRKYGVLQVLIIRMLMACFQCYTINALVIYLIGFMYYFLF